VMMSTLILNMVTAPRSRDKLRRCLTRFHEVPGTLENVDCC